jgi:hypothetical protein
MKLGSKDRCLEEVQEVVSRLCQEEDMCKPRNSSRVVSSGSSPPESWTSCPPLKAMVAGAHRMKRTSVTGSRFGAKSCATKHDFLLQQSLSAVPYSIFSNSQSSTSQMLISRHHNPISAFVSYSHSHCSADYQQKRP